MACLDCCFDVGALSLRAGFGLGGRVPHIVLVVASGSCPFWASFVVITWNEEDSVSVCCVFASFFIFCQYVWSFLGLVVWSENPSQNLCGHCASGNCFPFVGLYGECCSEPLSVLLALLLVVEIHVRKRWRSVSVFCEHVFPSSLCGLHTSFTTRENQQLLPFIPCW